MDESLKKPSFRNLNYAFFSMVTIVALSNYLVLFPLNDWLTLAAVTYPVCFLITELTNRLYGPVQARKVVYVGFAVAVILSIWLATPQIAFASGTAFLVSQLLDISIFNRLRRAPWWYAPFFASFFASLIDALIFWNLAFLGEDVPLLTWALGDTAIKVMMDIVLLTPFRLAIRKMPLVT